MNSSRVLFFQIMRLSRRLLVVSCLLPVFMVAWLARSQILILIQRAIPQTRPITSLLNTKGPSILRPAATGYNQLTSSFSTTQTSSQSSMSSSEPTASEAAPVPETLPKLSPADFKVYNKLAEHMDYFHTHFRHSWTTLYNACENNRRPQGMSIRQFLQIGLQLVSHLETHHQIEEHYVFPNLARKMPKFREKDHLINQHREIHNGLELLEKYLDSCRSGEKELQLSELKGVMDTFGKVLWEHLDDEVEQLGAENMRKFWSKDEMRTLSL